MSRTFKSLLFPLLGGFALILLVHAQDESGFISIDCGLAGDSSYTEKTTGINYTSDTNFIDTGEVKFVSHDYKNEYQQQYWSVRSFPEGIRNCYKINVTSGSKYLIRASFLYGNYDGQNKFAEFELHLGPNLWDYVKFGEYGVDFELIHIPLRNYMHICLVNTGSGVPFISTIEIRPLLNETYQTQVGSLALVSRYDTGALAATFEGYRYPKDIHDRFWYIYARDDWTQINTSLTVNPGLFYKPPSDVMCTAATPKSASGSLDFSWKPVDKNSEYYVYMHFAEVEKLKTNHSRQQYVTKNGVLFQELFSPEYLYTRTLFTRLAVGGEVQYNFSIFAAENSTLKPIVNAIELYMVKEFLEPETNEEDFDAITNIKSTYKITKNWQGDPCAPEVFLWNGLNCSYRENETPRITSLNLSSNGLTGEIALSIANLTMIQTLDLSNNSLTGQIPEFLSQLPNLNVLNLEKNKLTGPVPVGLIERRNNGLLSLSFCENLNTSEQVSCEKKEMKKKKQNSNIVPIVVPIVGISILLLSVAAIWWGIKRRRQNGKTFVMMQIKATIGSLESRKRQFAYSDILTITNNLEKILGKGGFGTVYYGCIDKTEVAVKMLSPSSVQGPQQFHADVDLLLRVHHINLISLVGYCNDKTNKGLVYEYMANGNLQKHLSGSSSNVLTWEGRLQRAIEAAQGLEYMHHGCTPPMIHRDVKSSNILLNENFQAKISDFGLSRNFTVEDGTHILTGVAGTPGYLAPEYHYSNRLNEKSDVYSFGVVLLEIITGRPVYSNTHDERIHISNWVAFMLSNGDISGIVDRRLEGSFNVNSVWKAVEIATSCTSADAIKRPTMSEVVMGIRECLATELAQTNQTGTETNLVPMESPTVR
ncbi:PREDICTED: probable LRR receptor-like serine/threonine-protein kinase At1g05700 [Prunus mume]|uniref:non-specific serine/threonine protein kinase n=1 Tax=Prunus mume TaxID=102107 RepID=A0ABM1LNB7_PRUMU|nr:PREDICTED: probable LRR receptor-like serine/threonine-protein kinase At1g05700 [Prunus mume]